AGCCPRRHCPGSAVPLTARGGCRYGGRMTLTDAALARRLATESGRLLLDIRGAETDAETARNRGDRESSDYLVRELNEHRPGDAVVSEEQQDDAARLAADRVWIVDPLDGTREFGEDGRPDWAVHVALWQQGELARSEERRVGQGGRARGWR